MDFLQITQAVALEHVGCPQQNNQGNLLFYGLSKKEGPKLCSREPAAWAGCVTDCQEGENHGLGCLIKQRKEPNGGSCPRVFVDLGQT